MLVAFVPQIYRAGNHRTLFLGFKHSSPRWRNDTRKGPHGNNKQVGKAGMEELYFSLEVSMQRHKLGSRARDFCIRLASPL